MTQLILQETSERILTLRMNRADKKNALTSEMYATMADALTAAAADPQVRVVVITGTADCFSSGNDVQDFLKSPPSATDTNPPVLRFMRAVAGFPKPLIAAVEGAAVGIGTTLLLQCDLVYAAKNARLHLPFAGIGICAELASTYVLPRVMGFTRAAELVLLAEPFTADKAYECGIVTEVLEPGTTAARARERALRLAQMPPQAVRTNKALLRRWSQATVEEAIVVEAGFFMPMLRQPEAIEAMSAFLQKRKPDFSNFV